MMKLSLLLVTILIISVKAAPYMPNLEHRMQYNQPLDQLMLNQIAQKSMEQWILQNQYNSMQQQMTSMQQAMKKTQYGPVPTLLNLPQQKLLVLVPNTITKATNRLENLNGNYESNFKLDAGDADSVVINAKNEENILETNIIPKNAVVVLPNGQRLIIGSIISAIPFLPFEVNVPDTIGWIWNGISGIIGGIGQRLPFRPKPTTESPVQQSQELTPSAPDPMAPNQEPIIDPEAGMIPTQENTMMLMQGLNFRRPNIGMPIIMLPVAQTMPIQVPIQV